MDLGDGLLFELENGKPRLILLSRPTGKNPVKQFSFRSRAAAAVLSCRPPSGLEPLLPPAGKHRRGRGGGGRGGGGRGGGGGGGGGANSNTSTVTNKNLDQRKPATTTVSKHSKLKTTKGDSTAATLRANENTGPPEGAATPLAEGTGVKNLAANGNAGQEEHVATLTNEQLQQTLHSRHPEELGAESGVGGATGNIIPGVEETGRERGEPAITTSSKDDRCVGLFGLMEERQMESRAAMEAKNAEWRRGLDAQVAFKHLQQQRSNRLQADEGVCTVLSDQSCKDLPAAIRSSLRLGTFTPIENQQPVARREEQRRNWLEELDRQREERRAQAPPPPAGSSLPLLGEGAGAGTGAESRTSYLRKMTSLLDPAQIEERERRRRKQMEQQRAIEAQMEERRRQREWEESERRREQEEEERRVEREELLRRREQEEELQRLHQVDVLKERQKSEQLEVEHEEQRLQENQENQENREKHENQENQKNHENQENQKNQRNQENQKSHEKHGYQETLPMACQEKQEIVALTQMDSHRDSAVQTDDPSSDRRKEKEPCEASAHSERNLGNQRRPEWNMQRPSRRFVPASERYPITLQKNRQQSRQRRQAELLALQGRSCLSRAELHPPPQDSSPSSSKVEAGSTGLKTPNRGRSALIAGDGHTPALEFVPYVRTDEVFNLDPLEPAETPPPPPPPQSGAPPPTSHTHRQQEILRGLAQLRQGLLLRQRELESDLSLHPP